MGTIYCNNEFTVLRFRLSFVERIPLCSIPDHWNKFIDIKGITNALTKMFFVKKSIESNLNKETNIFLQLSSPIHSYSICSYIIFHI